MTGSHDLKIDGRVAENHVDGQRGNMGMLRNANEGAGSRLQTLGTRMEGGVGGEQVTRMKQRGQTIGEDAEARVLQAGQRTTENVNGTLQRSRKATADIETRY